ncbi:MAG: protein kinase, partial [Vicinamibacterales bacterium]
MAIPEDPAVTATTATGALRPRDQTGHSSGVTLPPDLKAQAAHRLRIVATLYAIAFTVSSPITSIFLPQDRAAFFSSPFHWVPPLLSISSAIALIALTLGRQVAVGTVLNVGLVFQVIGSFGIAAAQYLDVTGYEFRPPWGGLSWVAVWMLGFTMMVPTPPRRALAAALGSATAVPLVVALAVARDGAPAVLTPLLFVLQIVVPYLLVVLIAYVGSRVVYHLGTALMSARELGSYRLVERLGEGGMGEVWRAEHRLLARPAAIKQMRIAGPESAEPGRHAELVARFEREAQATSRLRSPHTIELYDFGMADDGTFYYVMELLDGFDLQVLIQRFGPVPVERAAHLMQQVCHSLSEA